MNFCNKLYDTILSCEVFCDNAAVKVRLYPDTQQQIHLAQSFGCARWYWNYSLALTQKTYQETGLGLSRGAIQSLLPGLKKEYQWLTEPYSQCLQVVALNLSNAFMFPKLKLVEAKIFKPIVSFN